MHTSSVEPWRHEHVFLSGDHERNERRVWLVVALTAATMVVEIAAGAAFGSLALIADGWHMSTHAGALAIAALAYRYASRHARDPRFSFGTGKLGDLAGFTNGIVLALVALLIGWESLVRLSEPVAIGYRQAIAVAVLGLAVNLICARLLHADHHHDHEDHHHHDRAHDEDHNLRGAYLHVLADAATSVLAIAGLITAAAFNLPWIDPLIGLLGMALILRWSWSLVRDTGAVLIDAVPDRALADRIRQRLEQEGDRVTDLHLWRVGPGHNAAVVSIVSSAPQAPDHYKRRLADLPGLSHVTVEPQPCEPDRRPALA